MCVFCVKEFIREKRQEYFLQYSLIEDFLCLYFVTPYFIYIAYHLHDR